MKHAFTTHRTALAITGAVLAAALALGIATLLSGTAPGDAKDAAAARRAATRGFTDKVTEPLYAPTQIRPSSARPAKLPPMIRSTGACATAMNAVRDFQDAHPYGLTLTQPQSDQLAKLMAAVGPDSPGAACTDTLAQRFRLQEFEPWQTWRAGPAVADSPARATAPAPRAKVARKH